MVVAIFVAVGLCLVCRGCYPLGDEVLETYVTKVGVEFSFPSGCVVCSKMGVLEGFLIRVLMFLFATAF